MQKAPSDARPAVSRRVNERDMKAPTFRGSIRLFIALVSLLTFAAGLTIGAGASRTSTLASLTAKSRTTVTVIAGYPTPLEFTLSRTSDLPTGTLIFKVTNRGLIASSFELCKAPASSAAQESRNSCSGVTTNELKPGQSGSFTVTITRPGRYEYLSTTFGEAARGMKGVIGIGVSLVSASVAPTDTVTSETCVGRCAPPTVSTTPAVKPPAVETLDGDPSVGAPLFAQNCGSCHALAAAGTTSTIGPNLDEVAPSQTTIVSYVQYGSDSMPAFGGTLSGAQINDLAAYVYASTHSG